MAIAESQTNSHPCTEPKLILWLRSLGGKIKRNKLKRAFMLVGSLVIVIAALLSYRANASRFHPAINMSSTLHMHGTHMPNMSEPTSVDSLTLGQTNAPLVTYTLTADAVTRAGLPDQWGFNGMVPGPELRVQQGDHVRVILVNNLPAATSIHWHGMNVPNAADGVAGVTQDAVQPGQSYTYDFIAADPGTYWYHSHQDTSNQVPQGLLGALIVEPENLPNYDHDYTLMYHDYVSPSRELGAIVDRIAGNIDEDAIAVNGTNTHLQLTAAPGELVRLRLINGSAGEHRAFGDPLRIVPLGVEFQVVALDGHDLNEPQDISGQILPIGAGQRYDLVFRMPDTGVVQLVVEDQTTTVTLGQGEIATPDLSTFPTFDLATYGSPAPDELASQSNFDVIEDLVLGNRPGFHNGRFGLNHTINGEEFPDIPMLMVESGQTVRLHIVNETDEYHPIHIHGHYFTVLSHNNIPLSGSPVYLDSILVAPEETWDVAFIANNPGLWMLHCHVLIHAATGMDMMVVYPNISTPYVVGESSGNIPE
jgi:FtsP/CotA-like multicopper oxidase with cupredoxin domain